MGINWINSKRCFFSQLRFLHPIETLRENGVLDLDEDLYPFGSDLQNFTKIIHDYVRGYIHIYYPDDKSVLKDVFLQKFWTAIRSYRALSSPTKKDESSIPPLSGRNALVKVLADYIIHVTGLHNHVGNVADYLKDPTFASGKIRPGREIADVQATFQGLNIALLTAQRKPKLINDFTHLLLKDEHNSKTIELLNKFQKDLINLSQSIEQKNLIRKIPCNSFNPSTMMSSISI